MGAPLKPSQLGRVLHRISELYLKGRRQYEIAEILKKEGIGVSTHSVQRYLKLLQQEWRRERINNINEAKQRELEKIDLLEREYYAAWMRSQRMAVKHVDRTGTIGTTKGDSLVDEHTVTKEKQVGDPRYLQGIQWCIDKRSEILGINSATRQEAQGITVKSIVIQLPQGAQAQLGTIPAALPIPFEEENVVDGQVSESEVLSEDGSRENISQD